MERTALLTEKPDLVVEVAGHEGLREHGPAILRAGVDLMLISVGALADADLMREIMDAMQSSGARVRIVSGAIGALDALAAASLDGLSTVTYTMRKPPHALLAPEESTRLTVAQEVFCGSARQAVLQFPEILKCGSCCCVGGSGI